MTKVNANIIEIPVKLLFSDNGVNFFIKNNKPMNKFKMPDGTTQYGIKLNQYNIKAVKNMVSVGYMSQIEISRAEFSSKRPDILSMTRSNVFGFLVKRFDEMVFDLVIDSVLIKNWNRSNHGSILDRKTKINEKVLKDILEQNKDIVKGVRETLTLAANNFLYEDKSLSDDEIDIQSSNCLEYLNNMRSLTWFILAKFKGDPACDDLIYQISKILIEFMNRNKIAEYLSLMVMELLNSAENRNMKHFIRRELPDVEYSDVLENPDVITGILDKMQDAGKLFSLSYKFDKSETKVSARKKFEVAVFNKESEVVLLKETVDKHMASKVRSRSLTEFFKNSDGSDLGMYYLSYLGEECSKVGIKFESQVKEIPGSSLSYTTLTLTL